MGHPVRVSDEEGVRLVGGYQTDVRRLGDRLLSPSHDATDHIHRLLGPLHSVSFEGAPRSFGRDNLGRQVVEYLEGEVANGIPPAYVWSDQTLVAVAGLIRSYHDSVTSFSVPSGWAPVVGREELPALRFDEELICHNDLAPWNTVFRAEYPVAFIDWDSAAPGTRSWDVAFALWHWAPLYPAHRRAEVGAAMVSDLPSRVRTFLGAYGFPVQPEWVTVVLQRQRATCRELEQKAETSSKMRRLWRAAKPVLETEISFVERLRPELERRLAAAP